MKLNQIVGITKILSNRKINRDLSYYIDEYFVLTDWSRDYYKHYGVKREL